MCIGSPWRCQLQCCRNVGKRPTCDVVRLLKPQKPKGKKYSRELDRLCIKWSSRQIVRCRLKHLRIVTPHWTCNCNRNVTANVRHAWLYQCTIRAIRKKQVLTVASVVARNANGPMVGSGGVRFWRESEVRMSVCVIAFGRNLASVAVNMLSHLIYFIKLNYSPTHKCSFLSTLTVHVPNTRPYSVLATE
jgi:hypothetical protein